MSKTLILVPDGPMKDLFSLKSLCPQEECDLLSKIYLMRGILSEKTA